MTITNIQVIISFIAMVACVVVVFGQYVSSTYDNGVVAGVVAHRDNGVVAGVPIAVSVGGIMNMGVVAYIPGTEVVGSINQTSRAYERCNNFSSNCGNSAYEERGSPNRHPFPLY